MKNLMISLAIFGSCSLGQAANKELLQDLYEQNWCPAKFKIAQMLQSEDEEERLEAMVAGVYVSYMIGHEKDVWKFMRMINEALGHETEDLPH